MLRWTIWWRPAVMCLLLLAPVCSAQGPRMYCGEDNCYHILGVDNDASAASVRKAYRDLAKQYHPDKNKGPGQADAAAMFVKVAEAYEILSDDELRSSYDYYLAHPEERMRNQYRYFKARYKIPVWTVLTGFIAVCTFLKYWVQLGMWKRAVNQLARRPDAMDQAFRIAYLETTGDEFEEAEAKQDSAPQMTKSRGKKKQKAKAKAQKQAQQPEVHIAPEVMHKAIEQVKKDIGKRIVGGNAKPGWRSLCVVQLVFLPWTVYKYLAWCGAWWYKFDYKKEPYGPDEQLYLTKRIVRRTLRIPWGHLRHDQQQSLLDAELWASPENIDKWKAAKEREMMEKRPNKFKRYLRHKKQGRVAGW